ncbi:MAG: hypothetical protein QOK40_3735 [Miltoncostaeaceae bacterium]|nr:hypothetical protein [Miltoncostaeaceae bacterium]
MRRWRTSAGARRRGSRRGRRSWGSQPRSSPLVALALAAGALALAPAALAPAAQAAPPAFCTTGDLAVALRAGSPGAGQRYATVTLVNRSGASCRTRGYVGLGLLGRGGRALPTNAVRDRSRPARTLLLRPGQRAAADLHWGAVAGPGEPQSRPCEPSPARLQVTPPDARTQLVAPWRFGPVCLHGRIDVRPLHRA